MGTALVLTERCDGAGWRFVVSAMRRDSEGRKMTQSEATAALIEIDTPVTACAACPHPQKTHDAIATRYCNATTAGHRERGCVCSPLSGGMSYNTSLMQPH